MSAVNTLAIPLEFDTILGKEIKIHSYPVIPLSVYNSCFTILIVGYKLVDGAKKLISVAIINDNNKEILKFVESTEGIEGYFTIIESDAEKQNQIKAHLEKYPELPF